MNCPKCCGKTRVVKVVHTIDMTIRQLECKVCGRKFFSKETISMGSELYDLQNKYNRCIYELRH